MTTWRAELAALVRALPDAALLALVRGAVAPQQAAAPGVEVRRAPRRPCRKRKRAAPAAAARPMAVCDVPPADRLPNVTAALTFGPGLVTDLDRAAARIRPTWEPTPASRLAAPTRAAPTTPAVRPANHPVRLAVLPDAEVTEPGHRFRCAPYHAVLAAGVCVERQRRHGSANPDASTNNFGHCARCAQGRRIAAQLGAEVVQARESALEARARLRAEKAGGGITPA